MAVNLPDFVFELKTI